MRCIPAGVSISRQFRKLTDAGCTSQKELHWNKVAVFVRGRSLIEILATYSALISGETYTYNTAYFRAAVVERHDVGDAFARGTRDQNPRERHMSLIAAHSRARLNPSEDV